MTTRAHDGDVRAAQERVLLDLAARGVIPPDEVDRRSAAFAAASESLASAQAEHAAYRREVAVLEREADEAAKRLAAAREDDARSHASTAPLDRYFAGPDTISIRPPTRPSTTAWEQRSQSRSPSGVEIASHTRSVEWG